MNDDLRLSDDELVHLVQFGAGQDTRQFNATARRIARRFKKRNSPLGDQLFDILSASSSASESLRKTGNFSQSPLGARSSGLLISSEEYNGPAPALNDQIQTRLDAFLEEQKHLKKLSKLGLSPMNTGLFVGPPGVGKTLTARWLAHKLGKPLKILNLASFASSLFGQTGSNLSDALLEARAEGAVLLLDEFDAIAKGRSEGDIGEAKRVVTVLLQQIDSWPKDAILLAASNHGDLLDRAVWRRFDLRLDFPYANVETAYRGAREALDKEDEDGSLSKLVADLMDGMPMSEIIRAVEKARKRSLIFGDELSEALAQCSLEAVSDRPRREIQSLAVELIAKGYSQRKVSDWTGVSRDTLRKKTKEIQNGAN